MKNEQFNFTNFYNKLIGKTFYDRWIITSITEEQCSLERFIITKLTFTITDLYKNILYLQPLYTSTRYPKIMFHRNLTIDKLLINCFVERIEDIIQSGTFLDAEIYDLITGEQIL